MIRGLWRSVTLWGDLDSPLLWGWLLWGCDFGLSVVSFCLGSRWFLLWVGTPCGVSSLCHDDLVMGVVSEWGLFFDIRFW